MCVCVCVCVCACVCVFLLKMQGIQTKHDIHALYIDSDIMCNISERKECYSKVFILWVVSDYWYNI